MDRTVAALFLLIVACLSPQWDLLADSSTWDVEEWDSARLAAEGITFGTYDHSMQTENPSREWVIIQFDCS